MAPTENKPFFRPRARLLQLLGDQLIGSPRLAVFELVKNAFDADATYAHVVIDGLSSGNPTITVTDDGHGMSEHTVRNIWFVIAHDHREKQKNDNKRTERGRLPLGEKGLGRLAVHKLGNEIELVTRAANEAEVVVNIDWQNLIDVEFLEDAKVDIQTRVPTVFTGDKTGTRLVISELRNQKWSRGEVRRLSRQISSISSPFDGIGVDDFAADLSVPEYPYWLKDVPDPQEILKRAPWKYSFEFDGENFSWSFEFRKIPGIAREPHSERQETGVLLVPPAPDDDEDPFVSLARPRTVKKVIANTEDLSGIGPISGEFYVFDRGNKILSQIGESELVKNFLDESGGVRVYRDGMRVYNYGEAENDWLELDLKRVNNPTRNVSNNIVVGFIRLSQDTSNALVEKSNREGFVENDAYERLKRLVLAAMEPLVREREEDRKAIRELLSGAKDPDLRHMTEPVSRIRQIAQKNRLSGEIDPLLDRIESEYLYMKETLLKAGISGTGLAVVFHEIEQGIQSLYNSLTEHPEMESIADQTRELMRLMDGFSEILRKKDKKPVSLNSLIKRARDLSSIRFRHHNVRLVCPALDEGAEQIMTVCSFGLVVGALTNLIDNAIYWMQTRWPDEEQRPSPRALYINISDDFESGPAIVVADTGPGFRDEPSDLVRPFYTRRPAGMGMGLYYANMVMQMNDGELMFPQKGDADIPEEFDGAILALRFLDLEDI